MLASISGYETIYIFPKSHEQLLLEEIKGLRTEINDIKCFIIKNNNNKYCENILIEDFENDDFLITEQ
jgi:hypothetical protein